MDPRAELRELVRAARAWVEWVHHSGADDVPATAAPAETLASLDPPRARSQARQTQQRNEQQPRQSRPQPQQSRPQPPQGRAPQSRPQPPQSRPQPPQGRPQQSQPQQSQPRAGAADTAKRPRLSPEDRKKRLAVMAEEVKNCTKCRLHEDRTNTAFSRGSCDAEVVFVGEGPGAEEDRQGLPFVGPAGQLLDKMIAAMGYRPDEVYIANIVKCRPPKNRKPEPDEIAACTPYLQEQLDLVDPKVMVALGATGVQGLLNTRVGITRMRGTWKLYRGRIPLMPTFHPAYLLRSPEKKRDVWNDLKQVMHKLGKKPPPKRKG